MLYPILPNFWVRVRRQVGGRGRERVRGRDQQHLDILKIKFVKRYVIKSSMICV